MSFFADEKEPEMQIGYPTDVKHVAHIGWDGPSADSPSWVYCIHFPSFCLLNLFIVMNKTNSKSLPLVVPLGIARVVSSIDMKNML